MQSRCENSSGVHFKLNVRIESPHEEVTSGEFLQSVRKGSRQFVQTSPDGNGELVVRSRGECCGWCGGRCARCFPDTRLTAILWCAVCAIVVVVVVIVLVAVLNNRMDNA